MADPTNLPTLVSATRDANATGNPIFVQISDGTDTVLVDASGNMQVILAANSGVDIGDVDVTSVVPGVGATNLGKAEDAPHSSGDTGVMLLGVRQDTQADFGADNDYVPMSIDADGAVRVAASVTINSEKVDDAAFTVGTDSVSVGAFLADETAPDSVDEGDVGAARMTLDRKQLHVLVDATTDSQRLAINASGQAATEAHQATHDDLNANANLQVSDTDVSSSNPVPVSKDGSANSAANPIFVKDVSEVVSATEVHDYDTAAAVASDASDNHDYTVANTTFLLRQVHVAAAGGMKVEIQTGPVASLATVAVHFIKPGTASKTIEFNPPIEVPVTSTGTVRVIRTNRAGAAQDVYSTIVGNDV